MCTYFFTGQSLCRWRWESVNGLWGADASPRFTHCPIDVYCSGMYSKHNTVFRPPPLFFKWVLSNALWQQINTKQNDDWRTRRNAANSEFGTYQVSSSSSAPEKHKRVKGMTCNIQLSAADTGLAEAHLMLLPICQFRSSQSWRL